MSYTTTAFASEYALRMLASAASGRSTPLARLKGTRCAYDRGCLVYTRPRTLSSQTWRSPHSPASSGMSGAHRRPPSARGGILCNF
eukprot:2682974-Amphidinium_carterae.3